MCLKGWVHWGEARAATLEILHNKSQNVVQSLPVECQTTCWLVPLRPNQRPCLSPADRRNWGVVTAFSHDLPLDVPCFIIKTNGRLREPPGPKHWGPHGRKMESLLSFVTCTNLSPSDVRLSSLVLLLIPFYLVLGGLHYSHPLKSHSGLSHNFFARTDVPSLLQPFRTQIWEAAFSASALVKTATPPPLKDASNGCIIPVTWNCTQSASSHVMWLELIVFSIRTILTSSAMKSSKTYYVDRKENVLHGNSSWWLWVITWDSDLGTVRVTPSEPSRENRTIWPHTRGL